MSLPSSLSLSLSLRRLAASGKDDIRRAAMRVRCLVHRPDRAARIGRQSHGGREAAAVPMAADGGVRMPCIFIGRVPWSFRDPSAVDDSNNKEAS